MKLLWVLTVMSMDTNLAVREFPHRFNSERSCHREGGQEVSWQERTYYVCWPVAVNKDQPH